MITLIKKGQKVVISHDVPTPDGMLYADTKVTIDEIGFPDKDFRVIDELGKIYYINLSDVRSLS